MLSSSSALGRKQKLASHLPIPVIEENANLNFPYVAAEMEFYDLQTIG
jgi:hypothetical protein